MCSSDLGVSAEAVPTDSTIGGGAVPTQTLPSFAAAISPPDGADALEARLRQRPRPIIVRIAHGRCLLDLRTLFAEDLDEIVRAFEESGA